MDQEQLKQLIAQVDQSSLREFELINTDVQIRMSKNEFSADLQTAAKPLAHFSETEQSNLPSEKNIAPAEKAETIDQTEVKADEQETGHTVKSPIVGVVYLSPGPDEPVFKQPGDRVKKGDTLCIVEAMKVMNEIKSDQNGVFVRNLVEDGQPVEYDQPMFILKTEE